MRPVIKLWSPATCCPPQTACTPCQNITVTVNGNGKNGNGNGLTLYARFHNFISATLIWTPEIGSMRTPEQSKKIQTPAA